MVLKNTIFIHSQLSVHLTEKEEKHSEKSHSETDDFSKFGNKIWIVVGTAGWCPT